MRLFLPVSFTAVVKSDDDRVAFLRSLGWDVSDTPVEEQTVLVPTDFSGAYSDYNDLQLTQGFDLSKYGGLEAVRYTYEVYNHPDSTDTVVADILVYRNEVIGGDVKSTSLDGFMQGLAYPGGQQEA